MNEDDTFNRLRRCTYKEMCVFFKEKFDTIAVRMPLYEDYMNELDTELNKYGWTLAEFRKYSIK